MATRLYFSGEVAAEALPDFDPAWDSTADAVSMSLVAEKTDSGVVSVNAFSGSLKVAFGRFVSSPLAAQTITGTVKCYLMVADRDSTSGCLSYMALKVVSSDGQTVRGTLLALSHHGSGLEFVSLFTNRLYASNAVSEVECQVGDRLMAEIGVFNGSLSEDMRLITGAPNIADIPENETNQEQLDGWLELSMDLAFQSSSDAAPNLSLLGVG